MSKKLTPWFPRGTKPARDGVYQQLSTLGRLGYQRWEGGVWYGWSETVDEAARDGWPAADNYQDDPWRGLAENPAPGATPGDA